MSHQYHKQVAEDVATWTATQLIFSYDSISICSAMLWNLVRSPICIGDDPVTSFTKEVKPRLDKRQLKTNGRSANIELTSLNHAYQIGVRPSLMVPLPECNWGFKWIILIKRNMCIVIKWIKTMSMEKMDHMDHGLKISTPVTPGLWKGWCLGASDK